MIELKPEKSPRILESHMQQTVVEFLQLDGWRAFRTDPVSDGATVAKIRQAILGCPALNHVRELIFSLIKRCVRGKGFGEVGMPDYLFIRYLDPADFEENEKKRWAEVLWIEFKRPGQKPKPDQNLWHATETARGALVMVVDDIDTFKDWYIASGLNRRIAKATGTTGDRKTLLTGGTEA